MSAVQIVPEYPPKIGGVSSYAAKLACSFQAFAEPLHTIVTCNNHALESTDTVSRLASPTKEEILKKLEELGTTSVLLHFSGYGYARWGLCHWLVESLSIWKQKRNDRKLITLFHEVYATGPVWRASFWTTHPQRQIARNLARLSDAAFVTSQGGYERLKPLHPELPVEVLPVFSNVGEPETIIPLANRNRTLLIFGGINSRLRVYRNYQAVILQACRQLNIERIIDIGPTKGLELPSLPNINIEVLGEQPARQVSHHLSNTLAGLIDYPPDYLAKSSIFAAYCAHGVLPINTRFTGVNTDGLEVQKHYWVPAIAKDSVSSLRAQAIADMAHGWYKTHNMAIQTVIFQKLISRLTQAKK